MDRIEQSKQMILKHQDISGAFVASPLFERYGYCWIRDGTFIAYSMDCIGEHRSARKFYAWSVATIEKYHAKAERLIEAYRKNEEIRTNMLLHARFMTSGEEVPGEWGTYQLDCYGTWLWGISQHFQLRKPVEEFFPTLELIANYLLAAWKSPNFDVWEEHGENVHISTIAAIYGGLSAAKPFLADETRNRIDHELPKIRDFILEKGIIEGRFTKMIGSDDIDATLLWLHVPFRVFSGKDSLMGATVNAIEENLLHEKGVHRYKHDKFYGGGQWILLSAWLGWHYAEIGRMDKAKEVLDWIERQFDEEGRLPEQVHGQLLFPESHKQWIEQWGPPAPILLWSHAMYIILRHALLI